MIKHDKALYIQLSNEDKKLVDEFAVKLTEYEINSFMNRIISYYNKQKYIDTDVYEDDGITIVLENSLPLTHNEINKQVKIPYENLWQCFDEIKVFDYRAKFYLLFAIRKYIENEFIRDSIFNPLQRKVSLNEYLNDKDLQKIFYECNIGWSVDKNAIDHIHELYLQFADDNLIGKISGVVASTGLFAYRNVNGVIFKRLGVPLDKYFFGATGYSKNYKVSKFFTKIMLDKINITSQIKDIVYWSPKNSILHGYDNKTAIIWLNGHCFNKKWQLENGIEVEYNTNVKIDLHYTTDAYSKMWNRIGFDKKIKKIMQQYNKG